MTPDNAQRDPVATMTLEAFADTIIPGEKRWPGDRAIAGASSGGGAVASGAVELLEMPAAGVTPILDSLVVSLNDHATAYAAAAGVELATDVPPFVALAFDDRTALVRDLIAPGNPEREMWVLLVMFSAMAWDTGAHMHTTDALAAGHPGLTTMGFQPPDADGLWQFTEFSYGRPLSRPHPDTTSTGSPA